MAVRIAPGEQLNDKEIEFAKAYVKYHSATEAYLEVYSKTGNVKSAGEEGSRKLRRAGMATKIAQLQREAITEWKIDVIWLYEQYLMLYHSALEKGKERDAKSILDSLNKSLGLDKLDTETIEKIILVTPENGRVKKSEKSS